MEFLILTIFAIRNRNKAMIDELIQTYNQACNANLKWEDVEDLIETYKATKTLDEFFEMLTMGDEL